MGAALAGHADLLQILLDAGADVNGADEDGITSVDVGCVGGTYRRF